MTQIEKLEEALETCRELREYDRKTIEEQKLRIQELLDDLMAARSQLESLLTTIRQAYDNVRTEQTERLR